MKSISNPKDRKHCFQTAFAILLSAAILLQSGCGLFGDNKESAGNDVEISETLPDNSGYDIVLVLDESGSLKSNGVKMRNKAANIFVQMLTENCSLGTVFFSGTNENNKDQKIRDLQSLYNKEVLNEYLSLFGTGKDARIALQKDGTRLNVGLEEGLDLLENSSNPNQAIILFTDGRNEGGNVSEADKETKKQVIRALTANKANKKSPVPIYIVYLDAKEGKKQTNLENLEKLFSTDDHTAIRIDSPEYDPDLWNTVPWNNTSVNKIIATDDSKALSEIFSKLLNKMRNLGSISFQDRSPRKNNIVTIPFSVPEFKTTRIQLVVTGEKKLKVLNLTHVKGKEEPYQKNTPVEAGEYKAINFDADNENGFTPGQWELQIQSESSVSATVSLFSDFKTKVSLIQDGREVSSANSFTDTEVKVEFTDSSGKQIKLGNNWTGTVTVGEQSFGKIKEKNNVLLSQTNRIENEGELPVQITLQNGDMLYSVDSNITVKDAAPVILKDKADCLYKTNQHIGSFVDIGIASDFAFDAKDGENLDISVTDNETGKEYPVKTYAEMAAEINTKLKEEPDMNKHIFLPDRTGKCSVTIKASDSNGQIAVGKAVINVRSEKAVYASRTVLILFIVLAVISIIVFDMRRKHLSKERKYNVLVILNNGSEIAPISCMSDLHQRARIRIYLYRQKFFSKSSHYSASVKAEGLPFILDAGDEITLKLSIAQAIKNRKPLFGFSVDPVVEGDKTKNRHLHSCKLDPVKNYIVTYDNQEIRLSFSEHNSWNSIFSSLDK